MAYLTDGRRHLICVPYSIPNLHAMATVLGIKRCWYHGGAHPHYDIPVRRRADVEARCQIVTPREIARIARKEIV